MIKRTHNYLFILIIVFGSCGKAERHENEEEESNNILSSPDIEQKVIVESSLPVNGDTLNEHVKEIVQDSIKPEEKLETELEEVRDNNTEIRNTSTQEIIEENTSEGRNEIEEATIIEKKSSLPDHNEWDALMTKYVTPEGNVNYAGLKKEKKSIEDYVKQLTRSGPQADWSHNVRLAFWINLYNASTVNLILDNYPLKSIMDINGGKAWDLKLINLADEQLSLNDIEHNIIRKRFNEPRIHFAVNCAAKSCPKLLNAAFLPETLDRQLEAQTKYFIGNTDKNNISLEKLELSSIFDWYGSDFGDVKIFIKKYEPTLNANLTISYLEYDWALNE